MESLKGRLLITGGAGFIGSNFIHYWCKNHPNDDISVIDVLSYAGNLDNLSPLIERKQISFIEGNISDKQLIPELLRDKLIDTIVHFAAETHVDRSIHGPDAFIETNIVGTHNLLKAARTVWLNKDNVHLSHRFHHVSTDEVYGALKTDEPAFKETTAYDPSSPYSASKAASDHLVRSYQRTYGLNTTISNCTNNYGPYHYPEKLIPLVILNILHGKNIPIYGDGMNVRDWLYVEDHCRGIDLILQNGKTGHSYNIGGSCELRNIDVVESICRIIDKILSDEPKFISNYPNAPVFNDLTSINLITYIEDRPGHDWRYAMDIGKISNQLGFSPKESFDSGLRKTVQWYINNPSWWAPLLNQSHEDWIAKLYGTN